MIEKNERYIRIRILDPKYFKKNSFKTIDVGRKGYSKIINARLKSNNEWRTQAVLISREETPMMKNELKKQAMELRKIYRKKWRTFQNSKEKVYIQIKPYKSKKKEGIKLNKKTNQKSIIVDVEGGIANYFYGEKGSFIEVNKNLKKYPSLYKSVIAHELEHSKSKNRYFDFKIEFKDLSIKREWELLKFSLMHPKAIIQYSPIVKDHNGIYAKDNFMLMLYSFIILFGGLFYLIWYSI